MKILFCIQLLTEMDNPWLYTNFLTNYFKRYMEELYQETHNLQMAVLMGEAPEMVYVEHPGVQKYVITQNQMTRNGEYSHRKIVREYFRFCHERAEVPEFLEYHVDLIHKIVDFTPDIIISRDNAPYLEWCFPEALTLYTEVGFISRKPFGQTMYFDLLGMNCGSYLHKYWPQIEADFTWNGKDRELLQRLKKSVTSCIMRHNPYTELLQLWSQDFEKLYLLPLQFSGFSNIDAEIGFESQFDVLTYVMDLVPKNVGVVVTTHPDYNVLNAGTLRFVRRKYPNLLYSEVFLDYNSSSQYLLGLVDGVINLSSTVGLQTLFWDIPCLSIAKYFASYVGRPFQQDSVYTALSEAERERNDKVLFWLLTHYILPPEHLWNGRNFYKFLVNLYRRHKTGRLHELYPMFDSPQKIMEDIIRNLDENIPEPRGRLLQLLDAENIRNPKDRKRIVVFGTGGVYKRNKEYLKECSIVAFLDNDPAKQGVVLDGVRIISPIEILNYRYDAILLLSDAYAEMRAQLMGWEEIDADKIYTPDQLRKFLYDISDRTAIKKIYIEIEKTITGIARNTVLLVSNQMDFTGAPIVLFHAALLLVKNGFHVIVCSSMHGEIEQLYAQEKIPVLFDPHLNQYNREFWKLADCCDCLLINTLLEKELIYGIRNIATRCIWWIHESDERCREADNWDLVNAFNGNLSVYGVGKRVMDTFAAMETWKDVCIHNMLFGIPDRKGRTIRKVTGAESKRKIQIYLVGSIYSVKGQDIFAKAICLLPNKIRENCEFFLVGKILSEDYYRYVKKQWPYLFYLGVKDREEMQDLYRDMDILVCPSRRDTLPVVTVEAMMNEKVVIVSDCTGTANYIEDGRNGFVFAKENVQELTDKLVYAIERFPELAEMRQAARKTYEENFSMEIFERNFIEMIHTEMRR